MVGGAMSKVLIVEDEPVIAEYLTACIQEMGFDVVGPAGCTEALAILSEVKPQLAVLDASLVGETSEAVLHECQRQGIPVIISTGEIEIPEFCEGLPLLNKPYSEDALRSAFAAIL
jgi:DNA-binding NtrC family response regulator